MWVRDDDFGVMTDRLALGGHVVDMRTPFGEHDEVFLPVHGAHQADNAALAVAAVEAFFGRRLHPEVVTEAFADLRLPGRFEVLHRAPLLVLDGAHNRDGAAAAAATLADEFDIAGTRHWVLGVLDGRDLDELLDAFELRPGDQVVATTPPSPAGSRPATWPPPSPPARWTCWWCPRSSGPSNGPGAPPSRRGRATW